ncbi:MAG: hypothetical protein J7M40_08540 [Planctomycetes bacterium]|nr:hypothetical protein [Planctomycetota bacterium]
MDKTQIDLNELVFVLEWHSDETASYLDVETGQIVQVSDLFDDADERLREQIEENPERYRYIEPIDSHEGFRMMSRFVDSLPEGEAQKVLAKSLQRRSPFRNFKDDLYEFGDVQKQWYKFHNEQLVQAAKEWLEAEEIDAELVSATGPRSDPD